MKILNFGSINQNYVYRVEHIAGPGETIAAESFDILPGGKGANQSVAIARAGGKVFHAGQVGKDAEWIVDKLRFNGVDTRHIAVCDSPSGHAVAQVDKKGLDSSVVFPGCNRETERSQIDEVMDNFDDRTILLFQNEVGEIPYLMEKGRERGMTVCFNASPFEKSVLDYPMDLVDILVVNETEAEGVVGNESAYETFEKWNEMSTDIEIIVTRGKSGLIYYSSGGRIEMPAFATIPADATAAGDTFIGYYLTYRSPERDVRDTLKIAARAAAICVSRRGAMDAIPKKDELKTE